MQIGMVGLGRMGANMARRITSAGHEVAGWDRAPEAVRQVALIRGTTSLQELAQVISPPRNIWIMVPAGEPVDATIAVLRPMLDRDDTIIDGGNSYYGDSQRRAASLAEDGINFVDVGTSGGVWGLEEGYSLMIGGEKQAVARLAPVFRALAPSEDTGWAHVGNSGAGHFAKMIHNGIEYGMMQAFAEGFEILEKKKDLGFDLAAVGEVWRHGSVIRSWLLDLTVAALRDNPGLAGIAPWVADSGEGRWTVKEAIDLDVPAPVITDALIARLRSRNTASFADRLLAAMRNQFGGHAIRRETGD